MYRENAYIFFISFSVILPEPRAEVIDKARHIGDARGAHQLPWVHGIKSG